MSAFGTFFRNVGNLVGSDAFKAGTKTHRIAAIAENTKTQIKLPEALTERVTGPAVVEPGSFEGILGNPAATHPLGESVSKELPLETSYSPAGRDLTGTTDTRNIDLDAINTSDEMKAYIDSVSQGYVDVPHRSLEQVEEMAQTKEVLASIVGNTVHSGFSDRQILALRQIMVEESTRVKEMADQIMSNPANVSQEDWAKFAVRENKYIQLQRYVSGATAEVSRALNAMKLPVGDAGSDRLRQIYEILEESGNKMHLMQRAKLISEGTGDAIDIAKASRGRSGMMKPLMELWVNGLLSGPQTHLANIASNSLVVGYESLVIRPIASGIGAILNTPGRIHAEEVISEAYGTFQGFWDGFSLFSKELANKPYDQFGHLAKDEIYDWRAISSGYFNLAPDSATGRSLDLFGDWYARVPGRMLQGMDQWFKSVIYRQELNSQALRAGLQKGLEGDELIAYTQNLVNNPSGKIHTAALERAEYQTFTNPVDKEGGAMGKLARSFQTLSYQHPGLKMIVPFVRTPTNLVTMAMENTPLAPITKKFRNDIAGGGPKRDLALARISMGTVIWASIYQAHQEGTITGSGPVGRKKKQFLKEVGWRPNCIGGKGKWLAMNRADPFAMSIAAVANSMDAAAYADTEQNWMTLASGSILGIATNLTDKSYMKSVAQLIEVLSGKRSPTEGAKQFATSTSASFVPSWLNYVAHSTDDKVRASFMTTDPLSMMANKAKARTPWGSDEVPPIRDWKGDITIRDYGGFMGSIMPFPVAEIKTQPQAFAMWKSGVLVSRPSTTQHLLGADVDLMRLDGGTGWVFEKFTEFVGKRRLKFTKTIVPSMDAYKKAREGFKGREGMLASRFNSALRSGLEVGKIDFLKWYKTESPKHANWVGMGTAEWDSIVLKNTAEVQSPPGTPGFAPANKTPNFFQ